MSVLPNRRNCKQENNIRAKNTNSSVCCLRALVESVKLDRFSGQTTREIGCEGGLGWCLRVDMHGGAGSQVHHASSTNSSEVSLHHVHARGCVHAGVVGYPRPQPHLGTRNSQKYPDLLARATGSLPLMATGRICECDLSIRCRHGHRWMALNYSLSLLKCCALIHAKSLLCTAVPWVSHSSTCPWSDTAWDLLPFASTTASEPRATVAKVFI